MKKKIIGLFVCMLMIAAVPAVESLKNSMINTTVPSAPQSMRVNWTEIQKLSASDGATYDNFGFAVSLSGDTALIGAVYDDDQGTDSGSVYVFTRTGTTWTQQAKLLALDGAAGDQFGQSVSLDGDTAIIGAPFDDDSGISSGSAYMFTRTGTVWTQQAKLIASNGGALESFGFAVSLSGDTALIGAPGYGHEYYQGSAYVFTWDGTAWIQVQKLIGPGQYLDFGHSVSIDKHTALIGADWENDDRGSTYVYIRPGVDWMLQQKLLASDGEASDHFGCAVSLSDDTALIGAEYEDDGLFLSGSAYVFNRTGTTWTQQAKLTATDAAAEDYLGCAVSLDGDTALIGAFGDDDYGNWSGSTYVFTRTGTVWTQQAKLIATNGEAYEAFGSAVSLSGGTALIGAYGDNDLGLHSGSAYVFTKGGGTPGLTFIIKGGLGVKAEIKNNGTSAANDISWQIHVEGGILGKINTTVNGIVDIPVGESVTVKTGMLLGFGTISIIANVAGEEQTATGTQLIIFSMVKK